MRCTTSARKPSTPRSSQKRSTPCMAASTSGLLQSRSGCSARNMWRYHWPVGVVERPRPPAERGPPVVRLLAVTPVAPDVPGALRIAAGGAGRDEPRMPVAGVVRHPVEHQAQARSVQVVEEAVEAFEVAEHRIDVFVVGHVVPEVGHRRGVDRRQPDGVDAEPGQVVHMAPDALQIADAVAARVGERARVDLVDDAFLPPGRRRGRGARLGHGSMSTPPKHPTDLLLRGPAVTRKGGRD